MTLWWLRIGAQPLMTLTLSEPNMSPSKPPLARRALSLSHALSHALLCALFAFTPLMYAPASLSSAWAQRQENPRLKTAITQAENFKREGKFKEAAEAYRRAMSLEPNPQILFDIALMYQQGKEERLALKYFKRFIDEIPSDARVSDAVVYVQRLEEALKDQYEELVVTSQPPKAYVYIDTRANGAIGQTPTRVKLLPGEYKIIAELDGYVLSSQLATIKKGMTSQVAVSLYSEREVAPITFLINRTNAKVSVDGQLLARSPITEPLLVRQGVHRVSVTLAGHAPWSQDVRVVAQQPQTLDVVLQEQSMEGALAQAPVENASSGSGSVGPWVTMGLSALLFGGSAYTGFSAQRIYGQLEDKRDQGSPIASGDIDMGNTYVGVTNILLGLGAASLTAGSLWLALEPGSTAPAHP